VGAVDAIADGTPRKRLEVECGDPALDGLADLALGREGNRRRRR
jgi:hypothetical protein